MTYSIFVVYGLLPSNGWLLWPQILLWTNMPHFSLLKAALPIAISFFPGLCSWRLWLASPSFPVVQFSHWLLPNCSHCSTLKATHPDQSHTEIANSNKLTWNWRSFLGLCIYYKWFISSFTNIAKLLTKLVEKKQAFQRAPEVEATFQTLKEAFCAVPMLTHSMTTGTIYSISVS
jgi:hypothetical protein